MPRLVQRVYVHPGAPESYFRDVQKLVARYLPQRLYREGPQEALTRLRIYGLPKNAFSPLLKNGNVMVFVGHTKAMRLHVTKFVE